jgi:hypothetical protein
MPEMIIEDGKMAQFSGIIAGRHLSAFTVVQSTTRHADTFFQEYYSNVATDTTNECPKKAIAVLLGQKPILRSAAKSHLSLCACNIPYSGKVVQAIGKVSLFRRIGDFLLCPWIPP